MKEWTQIRGQKCLLSYAQLSPARLSVQRTSESSLRRFTKYDQAYLANVRTENVQVRTIIKTLIIAKLFG